MNDVLWFQMQAVFWRFVSSSGHHPRSIDQGGAIARSPSEWRHSDLLKPRFHHVSAAYTPVVIPYPLLVKMLHVLRKGERIFII